MQKIEEKILSISKLLKDVKVTQKDDGLLATAYPDFVTLKKLGIINIESEIRWYVIELYNLVAQENEKIKFYKIVSDSTFVDENEIITETYKVLTEFFATLSSEKIFPSSHIELDLGLDSIDYVETFIFLKESFGVDVDEKTFSSIMVLKELYSYVLKNKKFIKLSKKSLKDALVERISKKLEYSPFMMFLYKITLYPIFRLYFRMEVSGIENIPISACVIAPSHQSMLDGFLIEATLPFKVLKNSFFLAYKNVFGTNFLKPIADNGQTILIDANENLLQTMQYAALPLQHGSNVVIFPEGARTRDRELLEFRPFFAMLAKAYNVPVVPVVINGSYEALRTGKLFPLPRKIKVAYLDAIYPEDLSVSEIVEATKNRIKTELENNPILD